MADVVDLVAARRLRDVQDPPGPPAPLNVLRAAELVREYVQELLAWPGDKSSGVDVACGDLCCFADCLERAAEDLRRI